MADDDNTSNFTLNIKGPSIVSSGVQPFYVLERFIDKNTTIDADFARKCDQYHQYIDLTMIHKLCFNLLISTTNKQLQRWHWQSDSNLPKCCQQHQTKLQDALRQYYLPKMQGSQLAPREGRGTVIHGWCVEHTLYKI